MSKLYIGRCSVVLNTKGEIALRKDAEGAFSAENADELYKKMQELARKHKASISPWSLFIAEGGTTPVLLADRFGNPRLCVLPPRKEGTGNARRQSVKKLA